MAPRSAAGVSAVIFYLMEKGIRLEVSGAGANDSLASKTYRSERRVANRLFRGARLARHAALAFALTALAGCASLPDDPYERAEALAVNDPIEPANRMMFAINEFVDIFALRPIAVLYRDFVPDPGKQIVFNFVRNITLPLTIVNDGLQGEWDRAEVASKRFFVNTIAGFGGLADVATDVGLPHHQEDFGQTLATYQISPGPYLVLPLLGPSSTRHAFGRLVDFAIDPMTYVIALGTIESSIGTRGLSIVDQRYRLLGPLDDVKRTSLDHYAAIRSLYRQRRASEIRNLDAAVVPGQTARTAAMSVAGAGG